MVDRRLRMTARIPAQLVYVCGNDKGRLLYGALASRFATAHFVDMRPNVPVKVGRRVCTMVHASVPWEIVCPRTLEYLALRRVSRIIGSGLPAYIVFWDSKFAISAQWRQLGTVAVITDVAVNDDYLALDRRP